MKLHEFVDGLSWLSGQPDHDPALPRELARLSFSNPAFGRYLIRLCRNSLWCRPDYPAVAGLAALMASYRAADNAVLIPDNRYPLLMVDYGDGRALAAALTHADPGQERQLVIAGNDPHPDLAIAMALFQGSNPDSPISLDKGLEHLPPKLSADRPFSAVILTNLAGPPDEIAAHIDILAQKLVSDGAILVEGAEQDLAPAITAMMSGWPDHTESAQLSYESGQESRRIFTVIPRRRSPDLLYANPAPDQPLWEAVFHYDLPKVSGPEKLADNSCWIIKPPSEQQNRIGKAWISGAQPVSESRAIKGPTFPQWLARFDECQVIGHSVILGRNGKIPCELINPVNPGKLLSWPPSNPGYIIQNHLVPAGDGWFQPDKRGKTTRRIEDPVLVADRLIGMDYTHFLSEVASRLLLFERADWPNMKLLLTNKLKAHHRDILQVLGVRDDQIMEFDPDTEIIECRTAYAASWLSVCNAWLHQDLVDWYSDLPRRLGLSPDLPRNRRIYLSRGQEKSWTRKLLNEDEILPVIEQYGFEIINPESLDFRQKIELFYQAEAVAGSFTGGMMHCLFCRPGTKIVVFPTTDFPSLGCSVIASMLDLEERTVMGSTLTARIDPANSHFVVDTDALQAAMQDLGL